MESTEAILNVSCPHNKNLLLFLWLKLHPYVEDRAASTILISDGVDRVMPVEGRGDSVCPFSGENAFCGFLSSLCLHSRLNVSQPERQRERDRGRETETGRSAVCWEKAIESIHDDTLPPFRLMSY